MKLFELSSAALIAMMFISCADDSSTPDPEDFECVGACDSWDTNNNNNNNGDDFQYSYDSLPTFGRVAEMPWPASAWMMADEGIARRWANAETLSPLELYESAFGGTGEALEWEQRYHGSGASTDWPAEYFEWWGHGTGWATAALNQPEPLHAAEINGVRFEVSDIKALLLELYYNSPAVFLGGHCHQRDMARNAVGQAVAQECLELDASTFHVVVTNMLAIREEAVVASFGANSQSASFSNFNVILTEFSANSQEISRDEASQVMSAQSVPADSRFFRVATSVTYVPEHAVEPSTQTQNVNFFLQRMELEYVIVTDANGSIVGGEWLESINGHPDFLWVPTGSPADNSRGPVYNPFVTLENVQTLLELSREGA